MYKIERNYSVIMYSFIQRDSGEGSSLNICMLVIFACFFCHPIFIIQPLPIGSDLELN